MDTVSWPVMISFSFIQPIHLLDDVKFKMFAIFGNLTISSFGTTKISSVSGVTAASSIELIPWINPESFVWLYTVPPVSVKRLKKFKPLHSANFVIITVSL